MNILEAAQAMAAGYAVRREGWRETGHDVVQWISFAKPMPLPLLNVPTTWMLVAWCDGAINVHVHLDPSDLIATDWVKK